MRLPDGSRSRAILIGAGQFGDPELPDLPAVRNNLASLAEILTSSSGSGLPADRCQVLADPPDIATVGDQLEAVAADARDLLLVYYCGHGLVDARGQLCLALPDTRADRLRWTALPFGHLRDVLADSPATNRVLILDCCFSGRAIGAMSDPLSAVSGQIDITGTYALTSSPANSMSNAPLGATYTAFTGELLRILDAGIPGGPAWLSFNVIYLELTRRLVGQGQPRPEQRNTRTAELLALVPNRASTARSRPDSDLAISHATHPQAGHHDPLTGLFNLLGFQSAATAMLREQPDAVVMWVDLPTAVADAVGQSWGDRVVITAASRLLTALGTDAVLARLEDGSFAALLLGHSERRAHQTAEFIRDMLARPYPVDGLAMEANAAIGYALTKTALPHNDKTTVDSLLKQAEIAAQAARTDHRFLRKYEASLGQVQPSRFRLAADFRTALDTGQLVVHYQPRVLLPSLQVLGVEALARWQHPDLGLLTGTEFVPTVEAAGLVDALTSAVIEQALTTVRTWLDQGIRLEVAINVSVRSLNHEDVPDRLADALSRHNVPAHLITCELIESGVMASPDQVLPVLRRLHALGVRLTVDDFGTGYSSLTYLRQLPVDEVKIDKGFVGGMTSDPGDRAVVRSVVELGHALGLRVAAEGVENNETWDRLADTGCDVIQGHLISRPLPQYQLDTWLRERTEPEISPTKDGTVLILRGRPPM